MAAGAGRTAQACRGVSIEKAQRARDQMIVVGDGLLPIVSPGDEVILARPSD